MDRRAQAELNSEVVSAPAWYLEDARVSEAACLSECFGPAVRMAPGVDGRGLHSSQFQLNLNSPVHCMTQLNS